MERQPRFNFGRTTSSTRVCRGGCFVCNGSDAKWEGPNAVGLAARHHDATGHETWADQVISTRYSSTAIPCGSVAGQASDRA